MSTDIYSSSLHSGFCPPSLQSAFSPPMAHHLSKAVFGDDSSSTWSEASEDSNSLLRQLLTAPLKKNTYFSPMQSAFQALSKLSEAESCSTPSFSSEEQLEREYESVTTLQQLVAITVNDDVPVTPSSVTGEDMTDEDVAMVADLIDSVYKKDSKSDKVEDFFETALHQAMCEYNCQHEGDEEEEEVKRLPVDLVNKVVAKVVTETEELDEEVILPPKSHKIPSLQEQRSKTVSLYDEIQEYLDSLDYEV
ncbi:uncharacterized protein LOC121834290 [Ixodes scapularis]|uniref:uncharacterized protein LOC121834290 n=1 Tax=Ixodes scapularis TaxID=6945 RepID=UPI001C37FB1F|nr:uncharacterized protein LOC121834290 [Ixodes scapularis]